MGLQQKTGLAFLLISFAALDANATATSVTSTFQVTASIQSECSVSATALAFGAYSPFSATDATGTSTVSATCTSATPYTIGLDKGLNGASVTTRQMKGGPSGTSLMNYALYSTSDRATNWGTTSGTDTVGDTGTGVAQTKTVYGSIPKGQTSKTAAVTLRNTGLETVVIQAELMSWKGKEVYSPTNELLVNPPIFTLKPNTTQTVRIGTTREEPPQVEQAYRLFLQEVPLTLSKSKRNQLNGLQVALRISMECEESKKWKHPSRIHKPRQ